MHRRSRNCCQPVNLDVPCHKSTLSVPVPSWDAEECQVLAPGSCLQNYHARSLQEYTDRWHRSREGIISFSYPINVFFSCTYFKMILDNSLIHLRIADELPMIHPSLHFIDDSSCLICSPIVCIFCFNFQGNLLPIIVLLIKIFNYILRVQRCNFFSILCFIIAKKYNISGHF